MWRDQTSAMAFWGSVAGARMVWCKWVLGPRKSNKLIWRSPTILGFHCPLGVPSPPKSEYQLKDEQPMSSDSDSATPKSRDRFGGDVLKGTPKRDGHSFRLQHPQNSRSATFLFSGLVDSELLSWCLEWWVGG